MRATFPRGKLESVQVFLRSLHQSLAEEGEEAMSNASDSTVEQTKEMLYTVILLNFNRREKMFQINHRLRKFHYTVTLHTCT